jgi:hypothetical protein
VLRRMAAAGGIVLLAAACAGCSSSAPTADSGSRSPSPVRPDAGVGSTGAVPAASACAPLQTGAPPVWARGGFTGNSYPPFATSESGDLVALVFGDPLSAPPAPTHDNKILWVDRSGARAMDVTARVEGSDEVTHLQIDIGPSIVDLPAPGCWHLDLRIGDRHDSMDLRWNED